jgi:4-amino-4-deoxy-L-arabinose transferase-like glycosyltransferase
MNYKIMIKKSLIVVVFITIFLLAFILRKKYYAEIPIPGQSTDEYSYSWVGLSLIETGMPVGISGFSGYKNAINKYINVDKYMQVLPSDPLTINYPWMDHPPLLGLITGGYAYLSGARVFEDTRSLLIRRPIIVISCLSVLFLMIFCLINYNFLTAILGGLIYATTPLVVLSGRMIQAENAIIPCFLLCMIGVSMYLKKKNDWWLVATAIIAGIATLFKFTGFVCHLFVILSLLCNYKKIDKDFWKDTLFFLVISIPISGLFLVYGLVYGLDTFKNILFSNYNRFYGIGPNLFLELFRNQRLTQHKYLPEVWIISGWLIFFGWLIKGPKNIADKLLLLAVFSYLIVYIFFGSQPYGWYTFPFWPLLIIMLSRFLVQGFEKERNIVAVFLVSMIIFGANISRLIGIFEFQAMAGWWRFGVSGVLLMILITTILKIKLRIVKNIMLIVIWGLLIYTNIKYLGMINIDFWWQNIS